LKANKSTAEQPARDAQTTYTVSLPSSPDTRTSSRPRAKKAASWLASTFLVGIVLSATGSQAIAYFFPEWIDTLIRRGPVQVMSGYDSSWYGDGWSLALDTPLDESVIPPKDATFGDVRAWVLDQGGVDVGETHIKATLTGRRARTVAIIGASAKVLKRETPWTETVVNWDSAGAADVIGLYFNLDDPNPIARVLDIDAMYNEDYTPEPYFRDSLIELDRGELVVLEIVGHTRSCYCEWVVELELQVDGRVETLELNDQGQPFKTSAWPDGEFRASWRWTWWEESPTLMSDEELGF
jgi:hypothetical protein